MSETPLRDWIMPRLQKLIDDAIAEGFDALTATAVITDIIESIALDHQAPTEIPAEEVDQAPPTGDVSTDAVVEMGAGSALLGHGLRGWRF